MNRRRISRTSYRSKLDQLIATFVDGVLAAIRTVKLAEVESSRVRAALAPSAPAVVTRGAARAARKGARRPKKASRQTVLPFAEAMEASLDVEHGDGVSITDPAAVLALVHEGEQAHASHSSSHASPSPRRSASPLIEEAHDNVPASRVDVRPAARPGEEVLRATSGALVLRRRRAHSAVPRS